MKFFDSLSLPQWRRERWLQNPAIPAIVSGLLALALYALTLGGTYVYDDVPVVCNDPRAHHPDQWIKLWTRAYSDGGIDNLYRPIVSGSYAIEWWLHGDRPWIFHGVNILLHALAAAGIAEFTRRALRSTPISTTAALSTGLLFAAHPVHVEAVANIVGRAELLCTIGIITGLILLCHRPFTVGRVTAVVVVGIVAMLCKEQGILQPLLWLFFGLILWRFLKTENPGQPDQISREIYSLKILVLATTWTWAAYMIAREHFLPFEWDRTSIDPIFQPLVLSRGMDRFLMPVVLIGRYTALLVWPAHLAADYGGDAIGSVAHPSDPYLWIGFLAITIWIGAVLVCAQIFLPQRRGDAEKTKKRILLSSLRLRVSAVSISAESASTLRFILFCLLGLAVTYGMIGNILTLIATNFAERLLYLPSAFFLMVIGTLIAFIPFKPRTFLLAILLIFASIRTITAARDWNHPLILFQHGLANQPKSVQLHLLLSKEYHNQGNKPAAKSLLVEGCTLYPDYWRVWMFRAVEDMDDGDLADADTSMKRAIKLKADPSLIGVRDRLENLKAATRPSKGP